MFKTEAGRRWGFRKLSQKVKSILHDMELDISLESIRANHASFNIMGQNDEVFSVIVSFHPHIVYMRTVDEEDDLPLNKEISIEEVLEDELAPDGLVEAILLYPEIFHKYASLS